MNETLCEHTGKSFSQPFWATIHASFTKCHPSLMHISEQYHWILDVLAKGGNEPVHVPGKSV